jgi:hypothetical protein
MTLWQNLISSARLFFGKGCTQPALFVYGQIRSNEFKLELFHGVEDSILHGTADHQKERGGAFLCTLFYTGWDIFLCTLFYTGIFIGYAYRDLVT